MNRNVHDKGAKFEPQELLERSTGACLTVRPYLDYLKTKFGELYKL
jgi:carboxypeptidase Taq